MPLLVSCKKDSSFIDKDSYRCKLPFVWSMANSSVILCSTIKHLLFMNTGQMHFLRKR